MFDFGLVTNWFNDLLLSVMPQWAATVIECVIIGVVLLRIIFVSLTFMSVSSNLQYIIKGLIILVACAIDMRKYLVRK